MPASLAGHDVVTIRIVLQLLHSLECACLAKSPRRPLAVRVRGLIEVLHAAVLGHDGRAATVGCSLVHVGLARLALGLAAISNLARLVAAVEVLFDRERRRSKEVSGMS